MSVLVQVSGVVEIRRQLETQLKAANAANRSYQAQLDNANVNVETLTARLEELSSELASSNELGGTLHLVNSELQAELAKMRWDMPHRNIHS